MEPAPAQTKPTPADIQAAIVAAENVSWIDPQKQPISWFCELTDPKGERWSDGCGHTAAEAMAMAWLGVWAPDALDGYVEPGTVPLHIPNGFVFKLTPPWRADLSSLSIR